MIKNIISCSPTSEFGIFSLFDLNELTYCFSSETQDPRYFDIELCPSPFSPSSVDPDGRVARINYNNATRESVLDLPLHQVQPFYRALKTYVDIMNRPENVVTYRMEPGQRSPLKTLPI